MLVSLAAATSTAAVRKIFAKIIRQDKVHIIFCIGVEDVMNLVAYSHC